MEQEIRHLGRGDLPRLFELYGHLHPQDDPIPSPAAVEAVWDQIERDPNHHYLAVFDGESMVAACVLCIVPNLTRGLRPYGLIENVVTRADYRRRGLGRDLLRHALEHAWGRGCYKVMLLTGQGEGVQRFYEATGFDGDLKRAFVARPD